ncbi:hypothetical protein TCON_1474 [Astathelohania contejeani]|uniref:Arrestin C-terminal-like domain-containing protein n=1 Tax=Astathelohania contejeani TaxID=164912 RepID=A0ABQ7HYQ7_9MICR|nr:hypothetical protein TCON_1474 [Thelohania contejeani]
MDNQFFITYDKNFFQNKITGAVHLKTREPLNIENIKLRLTKRYKISVELNKEEKESLGWNKGEFGDCGEEYSVEFVLYSNVDVYETVSSGHHRFPFQIILRPDDNSSVDSSFYYTHKLAIIENKYVMEAKLKLVGIYSPILETVSLPWIVDAPGDSDETIFDVMISSCFCIFNDSITLRALLDKPQYFAGETAVLKIEPVINEVLLNISRIEVFFYQTILLKINGKSLLRRRFISKNIGEYRKKKWQTKIAIPGSVPSTTSGQKIDIKYDLNILITFKRSTPIHIRNSICIIKYKPMVDELPFLNILKGVDYPTRLFTIE